MTSPCRSRSRCRVVQRLRANSSLGWRTYPRSRNVFGNMEEIQDYPRTRQPRLGHLRQPDGTVSQEHHVVAHDGRAVAVLGQPALGRLPKQLAELVGRPLYHHVLAVGHLLAILADVRPFRGGKQHRQLHLVPAIVDPQHEPVGLDVQPYIGQELPRLTKDAFAHEGLRHRPAILADAVDLGAAQLDPSQLRQDRFCRWFIRFKRPRQRACVTQRQGQAIPVDAELSQLC